MATIIKFANIDNTDEEWTKVYLIESTGAPMCMSIGELEARIAHGEFAVRTQNLVASKPVRKSDDSIIGYYVRSIDNSMDPPKPVRSKMLKRLIAIHLVDVFNLTLTSDGRLVENNSRLTKYREEQNAQRKKKLQGILDSAIAAQSTDKNSSKDKYLAIEVTGVIRFGDKGSIIETSRTVGIKGMPGYKPHTVSAIGKEVGYILKNNGTDTISFQVRAFMDGEVKTVTKSMAPGTVMPIRKLDLFHNLLEAKTNKLSNAMIGGIINDEIKSKWDTLDYWQRVGYYNMKIVDGTIRHENNIQIGEQDSNGNWHVKDKYKIMFWDEDK